MSGITVVSADEGLEAGFVQMFGRVVPVRRTWSDQWRDPVEVAHDVCAADPELLVVGADVDLRTAELVIPEIDRLFPATTIVSIVRRYEVDTTLFLLRLGAREVLPAVGTWDEFRRQVDPILRIAQDRHDRSSRAAGEVRRRIVSIVSPKGGSGKTTLAVNLAVTLARRAPNQVVLLDLDVQFGNCAGALGLSPEYSLVEAVEAASHERSVLKVFLASHPSSLAVLAPPDDLVAADDIAQDQMKVALAAFAEEFPIVVVDSASGLDRFALAAMEQSTDLLVVSTTDVPSIRACRRQLDLLDEVGFTSQRRTFVLNRANAKVGLSLAEIEAAVGLPATFTIPSTRLIPISTNEGIPVVERPAGGSAAASFEAVAELFAPRPEPERRRRPRRRSL